MLANVNYSGTAIDFELYNHENRCYRLANVMGENGALLGFCGDIWDLNSVRHVLWLQRQTYKLTVAGVQATFIVPNHAHDLNGFYMSIPRNIPFPLLADPDRQIYDAYQIDNPTFIYINRDKQVKNIFAISGGVTPRLRDIAPIN